MGEHPQNTNVEICVILCLELWPYCTRLRCFCYRYGATLPWRWSTIRLQALSCQEDISIPLRDVLNIRSQKLSSVSPCQSDEEEAWHSPWCRIEIAFRFCLEDKRYVVSCCCFAQSVVHKDRLCGLVARVPGYRSRSLGFHSRHYHIFWEVVGLERGQLSLENRTEELPRRKGSGSGLENREYGRRDPFCWQRNTHYPQKLALSSPTSGGRSVGIVRSRTKVMEFFVVY
jgi:hypothetical protein